MVPGAELRGIPRKPPVGPSLLLSTATAQQHIRAPMGALHGSSWLTSTRDCWILIRFGALTAYKGSLHPCLTQKITNFFKKITDLTPPQNTEREKAQYTP